MQTSLKYVVAKVGSTKVLVTAVIDDSVPVPRHKAILAGYMERNGIAEVCTYGGGKLLKDDANKTITAFETSGDFGAAYSSDVERLLEEKLLVEGLRGYSSIVNDVWNDESRVKNHVISLTQLIEEIRAEF